MKIALIGYGKMGKAIEAIALERGHEITLRIDESNLPDFSQANLSGTDVAVEFTGPESAYENVKKCLTWKIPVVCGSTGWTDRLDEMKKLADTSKTGFIYASNFSVGVNIFFELNKRLALLMANHDSYNVRIEETHHTEKKDAPSGTAISLAEQIIEHVPRKKNWINIAAEAAADLEIISKREDPAPGTHEVVYESAIDKISLEHTAHNRSGFATGAVLAAEYIKGKMGFFTMKDALNF